MHVGVGDVAVLTVDNHVLFQSALYSRVGLTSKPHPATVLAVHAEESIMNVPKVGRLARNLLANAES